MVMSTNFSSIANARKRLKVVSNVFIEETFLSNYAFPIHVIVLNEVP